MIHAVKLTECNERKCDSMNNKKIEDVIIIGGGPVGMFASYYAGLRNLSAHIIEALPVLGGQVAMLYPEKHVYDIGGLPGISGKELIKNLTKQIEIFPPTISLDCRVQDIVKDGDLFNVKTSRGEVVGKSVLVTTGQGSFTPRKLPLENAEKYEEKNLHYYVKNLEQFRGKKVVILGGGDSAVEWALLLSEVAEKVQLVHRRDKFRAHEALVKQLENSAVEIITPFVPVNLKADDESIQSIVMKEARGEKEIELPLDELIVSYGFAYSSRDLANWGLEVKRGQMVVDSTMASNVPGIFGAGDVTYYDGKVKLIAVGFGEAPVAVSSIASYLDPSIQTDAPRSSELMIEAQKEKIDRLKL